MLFLALLLQAEQTQNVNVNVRNCPICNAISLFKGDPKAKAQKKVGKLLANGDCAGAERAALEAGQFDLADRVRQRCSAAPVAAQQVPAH